MGAIAIGECDIGRIGELKYKIAGEVKIYNQIIRNYEN